MTPEAACFVEYGVPATCAGARAWARVGQRRPIRSAGLYVAACRRLDPSLHPDHGWQVDGRLVAAGFRHVPPREWILGERRDGRRPRLLDDFVAFWEATQPRPAVVGSDHNADPDVAFAVWSRLNLRRIARVMPPEMWAWLLGPDRRGRTVEAARAARRASARYANLTPHVAWALGHLSPEAQHAALEGVTDHIHARRQRRLGTACFDTHSRPYARTGELAWLCHCAPQWVPLWAREHVGHRCRTALPHCTGTGSAGPIRYGAQSTRYPWYRIRLSDLDWDAAAEVEAALRSAPVQAMRAAEVPVPTTLQWSEDSDVGERIRACLALRERGWTVTRPDAWTDEQARCARRVLSAGIALPLAKIWAELWSDQDLVQGLSAVLAAGTTPPPSACSSVPALREWLNAHGYGYSVQYATPESRRHENRRLRTLDRIAQRDPDQAIRDYRGEYDRGRRLAPILRQVIDHVLGLIAEGRSVVVHGRDGELIYQLALRSGADRRRLRYAVTSRPLTTQRTEANPAYRAYLDRTVPLEAIHVDTGFVGSIPRWLEERGWHVQAVALVSASDPEKQIPIETTEDLREVVLRDLEHSAQRLECPRSWPPTYSHEAPGFWARLYGVCDALEIRRTA